MDYAEAKKKVLAEKPLENRMVVKIEMPYSRRLVLPHKDGMALLAAMANAEMLNEAYDEQNGIEPLDKDVCRTWVMSSAEYLRNKMAPLLGVKPDELKQYEQPAKPVPT